MEPCLFLPLRQFTNLAGLVGLSEIRSLVRVHTTIGAFSNCTTGSYTYIDQRKAYFISYPLFLADQRTAAAAAQGLVRTKPTSYSVVILPLFCLDTWESV